jgi:hypothetical protein
VRLLAALCCCVLIAGCAGSGGGIPVNPLVAPPWEAFVKAGPGAANDLDFETLDGPLRSSAESSSSQIASSEPAPQTPKSPNAIAIKAVAVVPVQGSTSEGNGELTFAMREALRKAGWPVLEKTRRDALTIQGRVSLSEPTGGNQNVLLVWSVLSPTGELLGDLEQKNEVKAGSLDSGWGENASYAAQAAAEGIFELIEKYR